MTSGDDKLVAERMYTRLKAKDVPQPWLAQKKPEATTSRKKAMMTESAVVEESVANTVVKDFTKRSRGRPKTKTKATDAAKKKVRANSTTTSTADVVLGRSDTAVLDVDALRRKREEDALTCGRHVRSVLETPTSNCIPLTMTAGTNDGDGKKKLATAVASAVLFSPPKSSTICTGRDNEKEVEAEAVAEEAKDLRELRSFRLPGKESIPQGLQQSLVCSTSKREILGRGWDDVDIGNVQGSNARLLKGQSTQRRRSPSPPKRILEDRYGGRHVERNRSFADAMYSNRRDFQRSRSRSPPLILPQSSRMEEYRRPRRSWSRSPRRCRQSQERRIMEEFPEFDENTSDVDRFEHDYRTSRREFSREPGRGRRYNSSSLENSHRHRRSSSALYNERPSRRSLTPNFARSSPRILTDSVEGRATTCMAFTSAKEEDIAAMSVAMDRRQRRHEQANREDDMVTRQRHGRKPFYLTLDPEGKPYGPGQPAWVAEISKLSTGLDPSCTHIRKQTFEDVQTFKDRLNEHFEYSGTLNEGHLRGLMGKAVTKRRGELISLIKRDGKKPLSIDKAVWRRLEKLAYSKQREDKSEQGRYANACRRTVGRTGARGVNGIREKLRAFLRRSPHPEEVEEEMQRDKGFGGQKKKKQTAAEKREENIVEVLLSDEENLSESLRKNSDPLTSDTSAGLQFKRQPPHVSKRIGRHDDYGVYNMDSKTGRTAIGQTSHTVTDAEKLSKDEYIDSLKAEIERLKEGNVKVCTSSTSKTRQRAVSMPCSA